MRTDEQLMEQYVSSNDKAAFSALYARFLPLVRCVVARHVYRKCDVEDLVQQTFLQLHVARDNYRVGDPLRPWLCTIAGNLCRDHLRRRLRRPEAELDLEQLAEEPVACAEPAGRSAQPAMLSAIDTLSELTRKIFHAHFMEDRALVEIARELGKNPATVRVRLHRGCQQLRLQLAS